MATQSLRTEFKVAIDGASLSPDVVTTINRAIQKAVLETIAGMDTQGDFMVHSPLSMAASGGGNGTQGVELKFTPGMGVHAPTGGASVSMPGTSGIAAQPSFSMHELSTSLARAFLESPDSDGGGGSSSSTTQGAARPPVSGGQAVAGARRLQDQLRDAHIKVQLAAEQERAAGAPQSNRIPGP